MYLSVQARGDILTELQRSKVTANVSDGKNSGPIFHCKRKRYLKIWWPYFIKETCLLRLQSKGRKMGPGREAAWHSS